MNTLKHEPMPYGSVLLVDDVETNLLSAVELLRKYRLKIDTLMCGQESIAFIKSGKTYDIIFMDHLMPELDGIEAAKQIRGLGYTHPIVALTANTESGQADIFLKNGFNGFLSKPIDIFQLDTVLNREIRDKQTPEVLAEARSQDSVPEPEDGGNRTSTLMRESFVRDAKKAVTVLDNFKLLHSLDNADGIQEFVVSIHGIKSSLSNIGEEKLSEHAFELEKAGRELSLSIGKMSASATDFLENLNKLLGTMETAESTVGEDKDIEGLCEKLRAIQKACVDYDRKSTLSIIESIESCSAETKKILDSIAEHVIHSSFEEAESVVSAYCATLESKTGSIIAGRVIPGLDITRGLGRYAGNETVYIKILRSYSSSLQSMLDTVESPCEEKLKDYKIAVHGIKGASYDIFAEQLGNSAKELEYAASAGNLGFINENNPSFIVSARKLVSDINGVIAAIEAENPKPVKNKPGKAELLKLRDACKLFDMNGADRAMDEIEKYRYEADDGLVEWLRYNIDVMGFSKIVEKLSDLMK
jgi:CheY-like chemotaxis protein